MHRLAALAHERGLRLTQAQTGIWFCSSASTPDAPHYVTGLSCDCRGFIEHQRCSHHALLLERLGWLPEVEEAQEPVVCFWCHGTGKTPNDVEMRYDICRECGGTGRKPDHRLQEQPSVEIAA